ncbi:MAG: restriction endonuclease subunit S [Chlamydiota bacterium]
MNWELKKLGDVCKTSAGGTPLKLHKEYYENGETPWLLSGEVCQREITESKKFISKQGLENSSAKLFPVNTVLIAMYGATAAQCGILKFESTTNQAVCGILPNKTFLPEFIYYVFLSKIQELIAQATGNAQPNISQKKIKDTKIPVPPLEEQKRLVEILDESFAQIEKVEAIARQSLTNVCELFDSYLEKVLREHRAISQDKTLKEVSIEFGRGKSKHRPRGDKRLYGGEYPLIQTGDIADAEHYLTNYSQTYNDLGLSQSKLWKKGTVCIAIVGANVAETAILNFDACFPDSVIGVAVDPSKANNRYLEYLLQSFKSELKEKGKGTARDNINMRTFKNQFFPFPDVKNQAEIADNLEHLTRETQKLEIIYQRKIKALEELKQSILQKAFTKQLTQ